MSSTPLIVALVPEESALPCGPSNGKLNYLTVDEGEIGGTVARYPRQKWS